MPVSKHKNAIYGVLLPVAGKRRCWKHVSTVGKAEPNTLANIESILKRHHVVGGCVQIIRGGELAEAYIAGCAGIDPPREVSSETIFRTASIAKAVCALLVMRLQTQGKLSVAEDVSDFWHAPIRNPHHPEQPIPLSTLLSHTSGIVDSPTYFRSFEDKLPLDNVLAEESCFSAYLPGQNFRYSNLAAGMIGSLLESRFEESFEALIQRELFEPLGVQATFDISKTDSQNVADGYRVLPASKTPDFNANVRRQSAVPLEKLDPQHHFLLASGNLYITARELAKLCQLICRGGMHQGEMFLNEEAMRCLCPSQNKQPVTFPGMRNAMGLLELNHPDVLPRRLFGHQGFAYGAVNGFFLDEAGDGFVSLNSGASEKRIGRLSCLNRDLIRAVFAP